MDKIILIFVAFVAVAYIAYYLRGSLRKNGCADCRACPYGSTCGAGDGGNKK